MRFFSNFLLSLSACAYKKERESEYGMEERQNKKHSAVLKSVDYVSRPSLFLQTSFFGDYSPLSLLSDDKNDVVRQRSLLFEKTVTNRVSLYSYPFKYFRPILDVLSSSKSSYLPFLSYKRTHTHTDLTLLLISPSVTKWIKNTHLSPHQFRAEFHLSSLKSHSSAKWKSIEWHAVSTLSSHVGILASPLSLISAISSFRKSR